MKNMISDGEKCYEEKHGSALENGGKCRTTTNSIITEVFTEKKNYICAKNSVTTRKQRKLGQRTSGMENSRCKGPEVGAHLRCRRREYQCDCNTVSKGHGD